MAKRVLIQLTIASPPDPDECTQYYRVEYKLSGDPNYTVAPDQNPTDGLLSFEPAVAATNYDIRITRICCNGEEKDVTDNYTTTA